MAGKTDLEALIATLDTVIDDTALRNLVRRSLSRLCRSRLGGTPARGHMFACQPVRRAKRFEHSPLGLCRHESGRWARVLGSPFAGGRLFP